jgi:hypothetical protein
MKKFLAITALVLSAAAGSARADFQSYAVPAQYFQCGWYYPFSVCNIPNPYSPSSNVATIAPAGAPVNFWEAVHNLVPPAVVAPEPTPEPEVPAEEPPAPSNPWL